jgi:tetratricopeptide (TPR) repeat protein
MSEHNMPLMDLFRPLAAGGPQSVAIGGSVTGSTIITGPVHIHWTATGAPTRPEFRRYLRMLAVVAAPVVGDTEYDPPPAPLDLWAEWRRLEEAIRGAWDVVRGQGVPWAVVRLNPPTRHHLADALAAGTPDTAYQVVHFSGHGEPDGLALEDELGRTDFVTADELVDIFRDRPVRLVVLNACRTDAIARRLHQEAGVPAVIATTDSLYDDEASLFTARLYAWLARGCSVAEAFAEARRSLRYAYEHDHLLLPDEHATDPQTYIAQRLAVPYLLGDAVLDLPPADERADQPLITLAEPPSRGMELGLVEGFVGRGPELVQMARWLRDRPAPVVALSGMGGIGKSALATMAVLRNTWRFQAMVALSARGQPHLSPDALVPLLDGALGQGGRLAVAPTEAERLERAVEALNETPTLLLLDNLEDLSDPATRAWTEFLRRLDPRRGSLTILTLRPAARHPLTDLAGPAHLPLERLGEPDALRLLADGLTARGLWPKVPVVEHLTLAQREHLQDLARRAHLTGLPLERLAALDELAQRSGCHPYAMRLALGDLRYPHIDWAGVLRNVSDLRGQNWEAQAEAMVGRMVDDLARAEPEAIALLQALLVFEGGATRDALRSVTFGQLLKPSLARILIEGLRTRRPILAMKARNSMAVMVLHVRCTDEEFDRQLRATLDASLLEVRGAGETARYDLHPLTRAYLSKHHPPDARTLTDLRRRHAVYFLNWARKHRWDFDALEAELPNLRAAFAFVTAEETRDEAMVRDYGSALFDMFQTRGYWDDVLNWMSQAARACERLGDQENLAICYTNIAGVHWDRGNYREALVWLERAAAIDQARGDKAGLGNSYNAIGVIYGDLGEMDKALEWLHKAQALREEANDQEGLATTWANIGGIYYARGDYDAALAMYEKAAPVLAEIGDRATLAGVYNNIGMIYYARGDYDAALAMYEKAAPVLAEIGDRAMLATVYSNIGTIHHARGDYDAALAMYEKAAPVLEEIGDRARLATVYNNIGGIYYARGDYDAALEWLEKAAPVLAEIGNRAMLATVYNNIGLIHHARGDYDAALAMYEKAAPVLEEIGDRARLATVYNNIGELHRRQKHYTEALTYLNQALSLARSIGAHAIESEVIHNLGHLAESRGDREEALNLLRESVRLAQKYGLTEKASRWSRCLARLEEGDLVNEVPHW